VLKSLSPIGDRLFFLIIIIESRAHRFFTKKMAIPILSSRQRRRGVLSLLPTSLVLLVITALLGATGVLADDNYGIFTTPPRSGPNEFYGDNPVYQIGTTLQIKWNTGMRVYWLNIWQQWLNETRALPSDVTLMSKAASAVEPKGTVWDVQLYDFDLELSNVFFFGITEEGDLSAGFTSHYFNLTRDPVPTTSTTTGGTDPTSIGGDNTPSPSDTGDSNLALKVGLGVGIPVVAICAFIAGVILFRRKRNNNNTDSGSPASQPMMQGHNIGPMGPMGHSPATQSAYPASVSAYTPSSTYPPSYPPYNPMGYHHNQPPYGTHDMGVQQLDSTPKAPTHQNFGHAPAPAPAPAFAPSELPGESAPVMKGDSDR
jgi:hypothetical protein